MKIPVFITRQKRYLQIISPMQHKPYVDPRVCVPGIFGIKTENTLKIVQKRIP